MKKISITHLNNQHSYWLRCLNFYKTEISILKGILTEIAGKNTGAEVMKEVEHFENLFRLHVDTIDRLAHNIHINIDLIGKEAQQQANAGYIDSGLSREHAALGIAFEEEEKAVIDVIHSFRRFAEDRM